MLIALLADTHDDIPATLGALRLLEPHKPAAYLHAGDLVSPEMLDHFAKLPLHFVFGNNEFDLPALRHRAHALALTCHNHCGELTLAGKRLALLHGHDQPLVRKLAVASPPFDYIITGHTHVRHDHRRGCTRHINPGALHRTRSPSLALLNLATDTLTFLELPRPNRN